VVGMPLLVGGRPLVVGTGQQQVGKAQLVGSLVVQWQIWTDHYHMENKEPGWGAGSPGWGEQRQSPGCMMADQPVPSRVAER
jgi:hypothetical protein